jgi:hypothetical protein
MPELQILDATGAHALGEIVAELGARGITVFIKGARPAHLRILRAVGAIERLAHEKHLFDRSDDAIIHARQHARTHTHERSHVVSQGSPVVLMARRSCHPQCARKGAQATTADKKRARHVRSPVGSHTADHPS